MTRLTDKEFMEELRLHCAIAQETSYPETPVFYEPSGAIARERTLQSLSYASMTDEQKRSML